MNLYQMTTDFDRYMNAETDEDLAGALAEITAGEIEKKAENYCHFLANLDGDIERFKAEEKRISAIRKTMENKAARVKEYMKTALENANIQNIPAGTFKVSIQKNPPALHEIARDSCPAAYRIIIPETWQPDTARIKEALKNGEVVYGYELTTCTSLRIK
jgi:hypothetical protein